ncbi:MAG: ribosome small subunit-dependent GTPase A [Oscillospiraceae bacterium]|jgi:ribosome biogenesis GTPase|nr:ribosome small subunit-dependent GTPase A [Oscillospiraceae bacterium]
MQFDGLIIKGIGGFYYVEAAGEIYECKARGVFRKEKITPLVGDYVKITVNSDAENTIDEIMPRKNYLKRPPIANLDQLIIVASICDPAPSTLVIDKLTAIACSMNIEPVIVINKSDLDDVSELTKVYKSAKITTIASSAKTNQGIDQIKAVLNKNISAITGNSGVGKSTILNCIDKDLDLLTGEISAKLCRGRHTTRETQLFKSGAGYIADTPGFGSLEFERNGIILKDELQYCFPEFERFLGKCLFTSCAHINDKGCRIIKAVKDGEISESRYESYKLMYSEVKNIKKWEL